MDPCPRYFLIFEFYCPHREPPIEWHCVRVVKESDLNSDGLCPRRFEPGRCRFFTEGKPSGCRFFRPLCSFYPSSRIVQGQFAREVKGLDLRSNAGNCAWVRTPQLTYRAKNLVRGRRKIYIVLQRGSLGRFQAPFHAA